MRKLIVSNLMSLDGYYVEGPDWPFEIMDEAFDAYNAERLRAAETLLVGRTTWPNVAENTDLMSVLPPARREIALEISRLDNAIEKVVVSDNLTAEQTEPWRNTTRIISRADAHEQIAELKHGAGNDILVFGSHTLWNDLLAQGLVDEVHLMIGGIVLGAGAPEFAGPPPALRLIGAHMWHGSGNILVRYDVSRDAT
jgi:dihydrofolate reductase